MESWLAKARKECFCLATTVACTVTVEETVLRKRQPDTDCDSENGNETDYNVDRTVRQTGFSMRARYELYTFGSLSLFCPLISTVAYLSCQLLCLCKPGLRHGEVVAARGLTVLPVLTCSGGGDSRYYLFLPVEVAYLFRWLGICHLRVSQSLGNTRVNRGRKVEKGSIGNRDYQCQTPNTVSVCLNITCT